MLFNLYFLLFFIVLSENKSVSQKTEYWDDEAEPFAQSNTPSQDLRLPTSIVPSFYRLKLKVDLEKSTFSGDVYITIRANKKVKEVILHAKNLTINDNAALTEQIYEEVDTIQRVTRELNKTAQIENSTVIVANSSDNVTNIIDNEVTSVPMVNYTQVTHSQVRNINIISISKRTGDRLALTLAGTLTPDVDYTLQLGFKGEISDSLNGFYQSTYTDANNTVRKLGVTQFEPTSARAAFPCFDEPAFKAKFEISIAHPKNISVLSNMKIATQESMIEEPDWQWTHFDRSVTMSTYLVAYVLSNFQSLETSYISKDNTTKIIKVWTQPALLSKANYALSITPKLLAFYEDVFGEPYVLEKLDLIAIPDFSSGAMENWGLITFRETALLFDDKEGVPRDKQNVAIDIAHELAHQWFGNLVTMKWWNDLWLNEGFATFIEYVGVDHIEPKWNMLESFSRDKMDLLKIDALKNTSPVSRQVVDASEISQKFDEISYSKGANLIRMLNHTISRELFLKGLAMYLNTWRYQNAQENDLWQSMANATKDEPSLKDVSIVAYMNSWTRQAGYPVVNVTRDYSTGYVVFEQRLFTSAKSPYKNMEKQLWQIPISYTTTDVPDEQWSTQPRLWLKDASVTSELPLNQTQALYVNVGAIGYYRVNYDQKNWRMLCAALKSGDIKSPITKAQLLDDGFNLAKFGYLKYSAALGLTEFVIDGEDSVMVWDMVLGNMGFLRANLRATTGYPAFLDYIRLLISNQLQKLNYGLDEPKDDNESFLVDNLLSWECLAESPRCLRWARAEFDTWMRQADSNNNTIPSRHRNLVYNMAIKYGGREEFNFLWNVFQNSSDPNVKNLIISTLPNTREEHLTIFLLEKSLTDMPKQYAATVWGSDSPSSITLTRNYFVRNFERVYAKFNDMDPFTFANILNMVFGDVSDQDELDRMKRFAIQHKEQLTPMSQTLQKIIDGANLKINWNRRYLNDVISALKNFVAEHANRNATTTATETGLTENITISISNTTNSSR
ncbi:aminopeptidase N-like isoform X2 [Leptidea sinapis]|uniref:aminopeptidase N-like isoform X2 n=1 Tax=Leptidea sinapis TaxID=189913 RepID=UPI00213EE2FF|nr:aminopeptidase N-like isoform X2 [Leptidea sinapis]